MLLILQGFHTFFLWAHDWVPLGQLNDVSAVRRQDGTNKLIRTTIIQSLPYTIGFVSSLQAEWHGRPYPGWLWIWLWISYSVLFIGELTAWWIPYFTHPSAERAARYRAMFGNTHAVLPERNGIAPNTLHCLLHAATLAMLLTLLTAGHAKQQSTATQEPAGRQQESDNYIIHVQKLTHAS